MIEAKVMGHEYKEEDAGAKAVIEQTSIVIHLIILKWVSGNHMIAVTIAYISMQKVCVNRL